MHTEESVGLIAKAVSVKNYLLGLNSGLTVDAHVTAITSVNAMDLVGSYDVVVDASDNVATRYLLNDACVLGSMLFNPLHSFLANLMKFFQEIMQQKHLDYNNKARVGTETEKV